MRLSWRAEGIQVCSDSHISPGPQQKGAEQQQEGGCEDLRQVGGVWQRREEGTVQTVCSDTVTLTLSATVVELTVGSGPDGDTGSLSRPLPGEGAHRQHVLPVRLQTVYGHRLSSGVRH